MHGAVARLVKLPAKVNASLPALGGRLGIASIVTAYVQIQIRVLRAFQGPSGIPLRAFAGVQAMLVQIIVWLETPLRVPVNVHSPLLIAMVTAQTFKPIRFSVAPATLFRAIHSRRCAATESVRIFVQKTTAEIAIALLSAMRNVVSVFQLILVLTKTVLIVATNALGAELAWTALVSALRVRVHAHRVRHAVLMRASAVEMVPAVPLARNAAMAHVSTQHRTGNTAAIAPMHALVAHPA